MAYPAYLRDKARQLRRERQLTLDELVERLALPRTTIWYWIADLPLANQGRTPRQSAAQRAAAMATKRKYRRLREAAYEEGRGQYQKLAADPTFRDFVCLYIAEGFKRSRNAVSIGNSDPAVLRLAVNWLPRLSARPLTGWLQYHADQDPRVLREFWSEELGIDSRVIGLQRKSNTRGLAGRSWRSRYGVLTLRVNDTLLRSRLQAWMDWLREEWTRLGPRGA